MYSDEVIDSVYAEHKDSLGTSDPVGFLISPYPRKGTEHGIFGMKHCSGGTKGDIEYVAVQGHTLNVQWSIMNPVEGGKCHILLNTKGTNKGEDFEPADVVGYSFGVTNDAFPCGDPKKKIEEVAVKLPMDKTCEHCLLQWRYTAPGYGDLYQCSDISIIDHETMMDNVKKHHTEDLKATSEKQTALKSSTSTSGSKTSTSSSSTTSSKDDTKTGSSEEDTKTDSTKEDSTSSSSNTRSSLVLYEPEKAFMFHGDPNAATEPQPKSSPDHRNLAAITTPTEFSPPVLTMLLFLLLAALVVSAFKVFKSYTETKDRRRNRNNEGYMSQDTSNSTDI